MKTPKRWKQIPIIAGFSIVLVAVIAYLDVLLVGGLFEINTELGWEIFAHTIGPTWWKIWLVIFAAIGVTWYIVHRDWTESLGIFLFGGIIVSTGLEDIIYFIISPQTMPACMAYLNDIGFINFASKMLGEACVSPTGLIINAIGGVILAILTLVGLAYIEP